MLYLSSLNPSEVRHKKEARTALKPANRAKIAFATIVIVINTAIKTPITEPAEIAAAMVRRSG